MTTAEQVMVADAGLADLDAIVAVMDAAFDPAHGEAWTREQCAASFILPGYRWRIARRDGRAVGFMLERAVLDESELMLIAVRPDARGQGIGQRLLSLWRAESAARGCRRLLLEVRDGNPAQTLYAAFGFDTIGVRRGYYRGGDGTLRDARTLALDL